MKCPKCHGARLIPEYELDPNSPTGQRITSHYCRLCGNRHWTGFTIRQPPAAETVDPRCDGARVGKTRLLLTAAEKEIIAAKYAEGNSRRSIARLLNRSEGTISNYIERAVKGGKPS